MTETPPDPATGTSARRSVLDILRWVLLAVVLVAVGAALWRNWAEVRTELSRLDAVTALVSLVLALLSPVLTMLGWRVVLADLGSPLHLAPAGGIFYVGQLGKYLPGSVWSVLAQAEMGARLGIPRRRAAVTGVVVLGMSLLTGGFVGLAALPALLGHGGDYPWWLIVVVLVLGAVVVAPPVLNRIVALGLRLLRRPPLEHALSTRAVLVAVSWFVGAWLVMGLAVWVVARSLAPAGSDGARLLLVSVCGFSLAGVLGMVSFLVPAGVGVRDGVLLLLLAGLVPQPVGIAIAVISRFETVLVDVLCAAFGWWWARRHRLLGSRS